jgi:hypothetical protein
MKYRGAALRTEALSTISTETPARVVGSSADEAEAVALERFVPKPAAIDPGASGAVYDAADTLVNGPGCAFA